MRGPVRYERIPLRRAKRYQQGGEVDPYDPLSASAGIAPAGTPRIDQVDWGQPSWLEQAGEQSRRNQEAFAKEGVRGVLRDTEGTQDLAGGFSDAGFAGTIKAFHGSPHSFERFSTEHVGTGEGAQAYGHGLYFAENPAVAEDYKQSLSRTGPWEWEGKPLRRGDTEAVVPSHVWHALGWLEGNQRPGESVAELIHRRIRDLSDHAEFMRRSSNPADRSAAGMYDSAVDTLRRLDASKLKAPTGKMYEVDINADPEHFLDWDKLLSEQHPKVQEALKRVSGLEKYSSVENALAHGSEQVASALREAGIPGIRYLDQGSRGQISREEVVKDIADWKDEIARIKQNIETFGKDPRGSRATTLEQAEQALAFHENRLKNLKPKTSNYVVFDDSLIDIIKKYGLAGLIAAGAAHFQLPTDAKAEGFKRGGAAQTDDITLTLTPEEKDAVIRWYHGLVEDKAYRGQTHYTMPAVRGGMPAPGSFRIPKDVFAALGDGDLKVGGAVAHAMFGIEDDPEDPTIVHPHAVRIIGNGNLNAGRRVLEKFVARVRRQSRKGVTLVHDGRQHDDGSHGWSVRR